MCKGGIVKKYFKALLYKELKTIFSSLSFWFAFLFSYLALSFLFLGLPVWFDIGISDFQYFFSLFPFIFIVIIPMLTVSTWTDEYKMQTSKLLFLFPISELAIVVIKYFSILIAFSILLLCSIIIPASVISITYFELPIFLFSYISTFLFGASCIALCLALASISNEPAISMLFSFIIILFFSLIHFVPRLTTLPIIIEHIINALSFNTHFQNAALGIFHLGDYIFFIAIVILGVSANVFILKYKKERV